MEIFEAKLRGFHTKAVQNIMARTGYLGKLQPIKRKKIKGDNITTYLRKYQINKENQNLAKRILQCQSQHNCKYYKKQWEKTESYLRVRSHFKKNLFNSYPKIYKFQPILGKGNCLITLTIHKFSSSSVYFRPDCQYFLKVILKHHQINPTNSNFTLSNLGTNQMQFYIPHSLKNKTLPLKIIEIKQNQLYDKGTFQINLSLSNQQDIDVINKQGKFIALISITAQKQIKNKKLSSDNFSKRLKTSAGDKENQFFGIL